MLAFILQSGIHAANAATNVADSLATAAAPATTGISVNTPELPPNSISLFSMVMKGGVIMIPLALLLLLAVYVMVERLMIISKASKKNPTLIPGLKDMIHSGNIQNARQMCKSINTPESLMLEQGVSRIGQSMQEIREAMDKSGSAELARLERHMSILNITGRIAPMFGFIGTIIGVIRIFYDISLAKTVDIEVISSGLYQKMITSAGGLVVGVIAFVAYHWLNARIDRLAHRMEESQIQFLDMLNEPSK
ncbi:MAG: MotA/TolQ/ExbB proton channel family protein [Bacteroidetes bacterium]|nr:MotA/TolQ/ExbB proton channel family protein [Bacteroidota bacterium]